jgi:hypothetical protein
MSLKFRLYRKSDLKLSLKGWKDFQEQRGKEGHSSREKGEKNEEPESSHLPCEQLELNQAVFHKAQEMRKVTTTVQKENVPNCPWWYKVEVPQRGEGFQLCPEE